jgi:Coenzyme PQQ synthesis protein D (PqqD)
MREGDANVETFTHLSIVRRAADQVSSGMAGEAIVLNMKSGVYFGMEQVAALIWKLLERPCNVGEIRDAITNEYEVDSHTCEKDLRSFLDHLQSAGLIEIEKRSV